MNALIRINKDGKAYQVKFLNSEKYFLLNRVFNHFVIIIQRRLN
jgi:hypothetical protein